MMKAIRVVSLGIVCAVLAEMNPLPLRAQSKHSEKNVGSRTQAAETFRDNETAPARAAIAKCAFVHYSGYQLQKAWIIFGGFYGNTGDANNALRYLLSLAQEQQEQAAVANEKQRPSKQSVAQNPVQRRDRKMQGELFEKKLEEMLPPLLSSVGTNKQAEQWPSIYQPRDPQSAKLIGFLQDNFQSVSGDSHPKTAQALAKKIERESTAAAFYTALAVAEWVATYSVRHSAPFELHTLLE